MPGFRSPSKSGLHRFETCALFRALLRQTRNKAIAQHHQVVLRAAIKDKFRSSHHAQGHFVRDATSLGYKTLRCFDSLTKSDSDVLTQPVNRLISLVNQLYPPRKLEKIAIKRLQPRLEFEQEKARKAARNEARESNKSTKAWHVYDRPMPKDKLTGLRKIPDFVVATGYPFLRYAKPQPPELSGMIRYKLARRHRLALEQKKLLDESTKQALAEDQWDKIVRGICGHEPGDSESSDRERYVSSVTEGIKHVRNELRKDTQDRLERGRKLFSVHLKEKELAIEENAELREQRAQERARNNASVPHVEPITEPSSTTGEAPSDEHGEEMAEGKPLPP